MFADTNSIKLVPGGTHGPINIYFFSSARFFQNRSECRNECEDILFVEVAEVSNPDDLSF